MKVKIEWAKPDGEVAEQQVVVSINHQPETTIAKLANAINTLEAEVPENAIVRWKILVLKNGKKFPDVHKWGQFTAVPPAPEPGPVPKPEKAKR